MNEREKLTKDVSDCEVWLNSLKDHVIRATEGLSKAQQQLAALDAEEAGPWKPDVGENYFFYNSVGFIPICRRYDGDDDFQYRWELGNVYRTREDAEAAKRWREIDVRVRRAAKVSGELEWAWYYIASVDAMREGITIKHTVERTGGPRFFSKESALACSDDIGEVDIRFWLEGGA